MHLPSKIEGDSGLNVSFNTKRFAQFKYSKATDENSEDRQSTLRSSSNATSILKLHDRHEKFVKGIRFPKCREILFFVPCNLQGAIAISLVMTYFEHICTLLSAGYCQFDFQHCGTCVSTFSELILLFLYNLSKYCIYTKNFNNFWRSSFSLGFTKAVKTFIFLDAACALLRMGCHS